jgi:hypothetical protein
MGRTPSLACETWGEGNSASKAIRDREYYLEAMVTEVIGRMPFLWLGVEDVNASHSVRDYFERNSIALLSNYGKPSLDAPSQGWLGRFCRSERVKNSGLWLSDYVDDTYDPMFLDRMASLVRGARR